MANDLVTRGKDAKSGRFLAGNKLSRGRSLGSKVKLSETFLNNLAADFNKHGQKVIVRVREDNPETYLKVVASLVPKELLTRLEISGELEVKTRTEQVLSAYRLLGERADLVEDAEVITDET